MKAIKKLCIRHNIFLIALCLTSLRYFMWDFQYIDYLILPRHDGLHGITAFATSMHSIRLTGEIAWWNPVDVTSGGWAQYFSGFLSPIAPTYGSFLFIGMVLFVKIMTLFSVTIPEYYLYIILNHFITPFFTCYFLLKFATLFCKKNSTLFLLGGGVFLYSHRTLD